MSVAENTTELGVLIDGTAEQFRDHCKDKDLGYVSGLKNHLAGVYQTFIKMKDDLIKKVKEEQLAEDSEEMKTIKGIYSELMKIEEKSCLCVEIIKERELKD
ncbi:MAG: hypothetical protein IKB72_01475 [Ruminococcus sp.]|nr:hypothetical protein [Ruminococcus sp.]